MNGRNIVSLSEEYVYGKNFNITLMRIPELYPEAVEKQQFYAVLYIRSIYAV